MSDILRDPAWQFLIGTIIAFLAIVVSIAVYLKQRQRKSLSYEVISNTPLLSVKDEIKKDLVILYKDKEVQQVNLVMFRIINSGNVPIATSDYERPITFNLGNETKILSTEIAEKKPEELRPFIKTESSKITLEPILLNGGESITFKTLVTKFDGKMKTDSRIIGVKKIEELSEESIKFVIPALCGMILTFLGLALSLYSLLANLAGSALFMQSIFMLAIGYGLMFAAMLSDPKSRRRLKRATRILSGHSHSES